MKCPNCNSKIKEGDSFCSKCGTMLAGGNNVKTVSLMCKNCNGILETDDEKSLLVCPYCGSKELIVDNDAVAIEKIRSSAYKEVEIERIRSNDRNKIREEENQRNQEEIKQGNKFKKSIMSFFLIIAFLASILFSIVFFSQSSVFSGLICILMAACFAASWLMGIKIVKVKKRNFHLIFAIVGLALLFVAFAVRNTENYSAKNVVDIEWNIVFLGDKIPEPSSKKVEIHTNTGEELWIDVMETSEQDYYKYIIKCKEIGYDNELDESSISFKAYNDSGYGLSLSHSGYDNSMSIQLKSPTKLSELNWDTHIISQTLPSPSSSVGSFKAENSEETHVIVGEVSDEDYKSYCNICKEKGFTIDEKSENNGFEAYNEAGYKLNISYNSGNREMDITLYYPMKFSQMNLPDVGIGSLIPIPKSLSGKVGSEYDWTYSVYIENMNKADYEEYVQKCIDAGFNKDVSKYETGFFADYSDDIRIEVSYKGNNIVYISITGSMTADYSDYKRKENSSEQQSSSSSSETSSSSSSSEISSTGDTNCILTIENDAEFASLMRITDQTDSSTIKKFVNTHKGATIEFDGCIALVMGHENYKTRFDVCLAGGNYDADRVYGPSFAFENVSYYDMKVSGSDKVEKGMNFRITAKILGFNDEGNYISLKPISLIAR